MQRFLVQVNRDGGFTNIINNLHYANHFWMYKPRDKDHGAVIPGDQLIVYCTGNVPHYRKSIPFIVDVIDVSSDQNVFTLREPQLLRRPIALQMIYELVGQRQLPPMFRKCGQQGFNIAKIDPEYWHVLDMLFDGHFPSDGVDTTRGAPVPRLQDAPISPAYQYKYTVDSIIEDGCFLEKSKLLSILDRLISKKNLILQGPPGTGKTWLAKRLAFALIGDKSESRVRSFQFHPNLSYEDFVRGWRPNREGKLDLVDGSFLEAIGDAADDLLNDYIVIIEEINRGIPAQIFGEMLTLIEADKRLPEEALILSYPRYANERIHIPPNLHIIGTMNLADRSLALVDFALRRRFAFIDLEPTLGETWRNWVSEQCQIDEVFLANIADRLHSLNETIATDPTLGPQFRIGHSVVTPPYGVSISDPMEWFEQAVEAEIAPLLREYWFEDLDKARSEAHKLINGLTL